MKTVCPHIIKSERVRVSNQNRRNKNSTTNERTRKKWNNVLSRSVVIQRRRTFKFQWRFLNGSHKIENMISNLSVMIGLLHSHFVCICELVYAKIMWFFSLKNREKKIMTNVPYFNFLHFFSCSSQL